MNSILTRFMRSFVIVIFATFLFFISLLVTFINSYSVNENIRLLKTGTEKIAELTSYINNSGEYSDEQYEQYYNLLRFYGESLHVTVLITDINGEITNDQLPTDSLIHKTVPSIIIEETIEKGYLSHTGKLGGFFGKMQHIYARPYFDDNGEAQGIVIMSSSAEFIARIIRDMMFAFTIAFISTLLLGYVITYVITKRVTKPLQQMSKAAISISQGNFKQRIEVVGNDEISNLSNSFNMMAQSLEKLDEMKSNFISNVSHELKTPMTTISGFIDGILDKTIPEDKYDYYLGIISDEVNRLSRLVTTLVEVARIDSGDLKFKMLETDYKELLINVAAQFEMKFTDKNINFELDLPSRHLYSILDYDAIYRVVYNLLDNAIKFTDIDGTITVSVKVKSNKIITFIKNTGIGIKESEIPFVFDKFFKSDSSRSENKKSFGLGLFLCRYIINGHGENIYVRSEEGKYAEFVFTLNESGRGENNV